jgi:peptidyl-tRNA hydrolase, PTH1 family
MKIIVGLGNPGEKYEGTRHNLGFLVLDRLLKDCASVKESNWKKEAKFKSEVVELPIEGIDEKILLVRPQTYMNNSGMAVQLVTSFYKLPPEDLWIVHDDLDLPLSTLKIRFGGAAAGHHGVENIIEQIGTDKFWRFRLGIGHILHSARETDADGKSHALGRVKVRNVEEYVIGDFTGKDRTEAKKMIKHASDALQTALEKGLEVAQNRFNTK